MKTVRCAAIGVASLLLAAAVPAQTPAEVTSWLAGVDAARNAFEEAVIKARAAQVVDGKDTGSADFDIYTKGRDRGLIVFRGGKNSGRKILTVGDRMWLLVPGASNPLPITANQRLMGGASVGDVARLRFAEDFSATVRPGSEVVNGRTCRILDLKAKSAKAPYPTVVLWYDPAAKLPAKVLFRLPSGREAKEVVFARFATTQGKTVVREMDIRDLLAGAAGATTRLEYLEYRPARLDDSIFTPQGALGFS